MLIMVVGSIISIVVTPAPIVGVVKSISFLRYRYQGRVVIAELRQRSAAFGCTGARTYSHRWLQDICHLLICVVNPISVGSCSHKHQVMDLSEFQIWPKGFPVGEDDGGECDKNSLKVQSTTSYLSGPSPVPEMRRGRGS